MINGFLILWHREKSFDLFKGHILWVHLILKNYLFILRRRESEQAWGRGRERGRKNLKHSAEPDSGLVSQTMRS